MAGGQEVHRAAKSAALTVPQKFTARLSICHCFKMTQASITKSSPSDTSGLPQDSALRIYKVHPEIQKGSPRVRTLNESVVGKTGKFQPTSCHISKKVQDRTKVTTDHLEEVA